MVGHAVNPLDRALSVRNAMRMNVRTNLLLSKSLVEQMDREAGPRGRSRYVGDAISEKLRRDRLRRVVQQTAGVVSTDDHPEWATSEGVTNWVREQRSEQTGPRDELP